MVYTDRGRDRATCFIRQNTAVSEYNGEATVVVHITKITTIVKANENYLMPVY